MFFKTIITTAFAQNCRIILDPITKKALVCDPGDRAEEIYAVIKDAEFTLQGILITHAHLDHVGGAYALKELSGAPIIGPHIADEPMLLDLENQARLFGLPLTKSFKSDHYVTHGEQLNLIDNEEIVVLHTPGHTRGGVCYYFKNEDTLLSGDTLFAGSIGRTDFEGGDFDTIIESIKTVLYKLPKTTHVLTGHGPSTTIGAEIAENPYTN